MNKKFKKRIMIIVCILSILVTSVSSLVSFGGMKAKASYDEDVAKFQKYLNANFGAKLAVDGDYGPKTERAAVRALQKLYNKQYNTKLVEDGIWGKKTIAAINKYPIKEGMRNNIVKYFQVAFNNLAGGTLPVGLVEDGIYGEQTSIAFTYIYNHNRIVHYQSDVWWLLLIDKC